MGIVCKIMRGSTVAILLLGLGCFLLIDPVRGSPIEVGEEDEGDDKLPEDDDGGEEDEEKDDEEDEDEDVINEKLGCVIEEGMDYKDKPIKSETTEDEEECADLSATTPEGLFWTWNKKNKKCFVKKAKGKQVKVDHAVGGNRECGCIIEEGTDYKDEPIKSEKQESQQDCADLSSSTPEGVFWTWNKKNKKCFVKKAKGKLVKVEHAVSGNRKCGV